VLYAIAHVPTLWALKDINAGPNPVLVMAALGCGLVWGYMARRFERLVPGMISHVLFDWTVMMMFRLWGPSV
jgi:membrane protease YdiL (CAAX protease family)